MRARISMATEERVLRQVRASLEPYDIRRNKTLAARYPPGLYPHTRRCAVLVPLFVSPRDQQLHVLLTQRASTLRSHPSDVALPGGARDPSDRDDDAATALREAQEEIGLDPSDVTVIAHLPPTFVRRRNSVYPVVGLIPSDFRPAPNPEEVALVFSTPLSRFLGPDVSYASYRLLGRSYRTPYLLHEDDASGSPTLLLWGSTCTICLTTAVAILGPRKRCRLLLVDASGKTSEDEDEDDNVFGDVEDLYHLLCRATRFAGKM